MSKPNLLQYGVSVGFFRNHRVRQARLLIAKRIKRKVDFCELTPLPFEVLLAYAAENQVNGELKYEPEFFTDIFLWNGMKLEPSETDSIMKIFQEVGLLDGLKIRSWGQFNPHLVKQSQRIKNKRLAGEISAKRRQKEAKNWLKNGAETGLETPKKVDEKGEKNPQKSFQKPVQKRESEKGSSSSRELWLLEKALEGAKGPARKELLAKKQKLLSGHTGVDLSEPAPAARPPAPKAQKEAAGGWQRTLLSSARQLLADSPELLTEKMVIALGNAHAKFPEDVYQRFRKVLDGLAEKEAGDNPVPG